MCKIKCDRCVCDRVHTLRLTPIYMPTYTPVHRCIRVCRILKYTLKEPPYRTVLNGWSGAGVLLVLASTVSFRYGHTDFPHMPAFGTDQCRVIVFVLPLFPLMGLDHMTLVGAIEFVTYPSLFVPVESTNSRTDGFVAILAHAHNGLVISCHFHTSFKMNSPPRTKNMWVKNTNTKVALVMSGLLEIHLHDEAIKFRIM